MKISQIKSNKIKQTRIKQNQEIKKERKAQSFKTKQQEVLLSGNTLGF